ncbi:hypothetical protein GCM10009753_49420 [Streptantibioticus ferralitis]
MLGFGGMRGRRYAEFRLVGAAPRMPAAFARPGPGQPAGLRSRRREAVRGARRGVGHGAGLRLPYVVYAAAVYAAVVYAVRVRGGGRRVHCEGHQRGRYGDGETRCPAGRVPVSGC